MKTRPLIGVAVLLAVTVAAFASKGETIQALIARAEAAPLRDRPGLYVEIATRRLKSASELYDEGKADEGRNALQDVVTYSSKAHDAAVTSNRKLKDTEKAMRTMSRHLRDMKHSLNYDDQASVQSAADRLEGLADDLLTHMFARGK